MLMSDKILGTNLSHNALHLIRAHDICSAIRYLFADNATNKQMRVYREMTFIVKRV